MNKGHHQYQIYHNLVTIYIKVISKIHKQNKYQIINSLTSLSSADIMNALIVSLNFNPGHFSHLIANYKLLEDCGFKSYLYVNKRFNKMAKPNQYDIINTYKQLKEIKTVETAIFWFPSVYNIIEIIRFRLLYKCKIVYIYHEPFDSIKSYYISGFRTRKILKICLINFINILIVLLANKIILPSSKSLELFKKKYAFLNNDFKQIPLIFDDEAAKTRGLYHKKYISYLGTIAADHAFDCYINFIESSVKNNWFPQLSFLIATKDKIPVSVKQRIESYVANGKIVISEGHTMSNEEINFFYNDSLIVWNAYNRSMQSGVLPKAYMFGAAILGTYHCNNEYIENHVTGVLVEDNQNIIEIKNAIEEILDKKDLFIQNCRAKFLSTFYYKNKMNEYISFLQDKITTNN